jgi:hypothetical protein
MVSLNLSGNDLGSDQACFDLFTNVLHASNL